MRNPQDRPNIILVNCDDLGYGDLGCYGSAVNRTPALDRMAAEGVRFTDFYMASSVCSPSRGAMMTGCYPPRIGFGRFDGGAGVLFPGHSVGLNTDETTIAGMLKTRGYATKIVGKWHCGDQPEFLPARHGFDEYYGLPYSNDMGRQDSDWGRTNPPLPLLRNEEVIQEQPDQTSLTERYVEECVRFIRDHKAEPFFLYLAHMHVHLPHYPPKHFLDKAENGPYGAAVECIDWSISVLLDELKRQGLDGNTLVIFTSDNGSNKRYNGSNAPLRGKKGSSWEGGFRVPCIMRWPGVVPGSKTCKGMVTGMDFLPTFAALAGAELPDDKIIDGVDISNLLTSPDSESPRKVFFYYFLNRLEAVRKGPWKYRCCNSVWEESEERDEENAQLYNLDEDISESTNLVDEYPEVVEELKALMDKCREDIGDERFDMEGSNRRLPGKAENPKPLTEYDPNHPYIIALYDLGDCG